MLFGKLAKTLAQAAATLDGGDGWRLKENKEAVFLGAGHVILIPEYLFVVYIVYMKISTFATNDSGQCQACLNGPILKGFGCQTILLSSVTFVLSHIVSLPSLSVIDHKFVRQVL
jgi:hypothetical protein